MFLEARGSQIDLKNVVFTLFLAEKEHKMPPYSSYAIIQDATDDKYTWKDVIYTFQRGCKPTLYNWQLKWRFCVLGILFLWKTLIGQEKLHEGISCCVFAFSPLTLDVQENDATIICCEAPEMFCGLRNFTWLSICIRVSKQRLNFQFWVNCSFNVISFSTMTTQSVDSPTSLIQHRSRHLWPAQTLDTFSVELQQVTPPVTLVTMSHLHEAHNLQFLLRLSVFHNWYFGMS